MIRFFYVLFLLFVYTCGGLSNSSAQVAKAPSGWTDISVCQLHFFMPKKLKRQGGKGIDSCVAEYKSSKLKLLIDYGFYSGAYKNDGTKIGFKEEFVEIDGKKAQLVTYQEAQNKERFVAGLYVLINEAKDGMKTALNMTIETKNEKELGTARQIFESLRFDAYAPFTIEQ